MKLYKFVPKTSGFSGHLMISVPTFLERLDMLKQLGVEIGADGEAVSNTKLDLDLFRNLFAKVIDIVKEVDLKYEDTEIKTVDELQVYAECMPVVMELVEVIKSGLTLGKS